MEILGYILFSLFFCYLKPKILSDHKTCLCVYRRKRSEDDKCDWKQRPLKQHHDPCVRSNRSGSPWKQCKGHACRKQNSDHSEAHELFKRKRCGLNNGVRLSFCHPKRKPTEEKHDDRCGRPRKHSFQVIENILCLFESPGINGSRRNPSIRYGRCSTPHA